MTQTQDSKHFSDNQWLEITAKLQKPNAPSKQAIPCEYCVSESAIKKRNGAKKTQYLISLTLFLNQLEFQPSVLVKLIFLN